MQSYIPIGVVINEQLEELDLVVQLSLANEAVEISIYFRRLAASIQNSYKGTTINRKSEGSKNIAKRTWMRKPRWGSLEAAFQLALSCSTPDIVLMSIAGSKGSFRVLVVLEM